MLEDHAGDFIETWSTGHGVYGEHGAESIHKVFNLLQRTYCSMQPATRHLQSMLKEQAGEIQREKIKCYHDNICLNLLYESNIRVLLR